MTVALVRQKAERTLEIVDQQAIALGFRLPTR
jgi:hypothetical protein